jgi:hypothetical protein
MRHQISLIDGVVPRVMAKSTRRTVSCSVLLIITTSMLGCSRSVVVPESPSPISADACLSATATPTSQVFSALGGTGTIVVTAPPNCHWGIGFSAGAPQGFGEQDMITSAPSVLTATSGLSSSCSVGTLCSSGSGVVTYVVSANPSSVARGSCSLIFPVSPDGQQIKSVGFVFGITCSPLHVSQAPGPAACSYTLSATSPSIGANGGTLTVGVSTGSTCYWTASSQATFVTIVSGAGGVGNGTVSMNVAPNAGTAQNWQVTIAGQFVTIRQAAGS